MGNPKASRRPDALLCDAGSAIAGWVLVAPMVISVVLAAVDITNTAMATSRVHSAAVRIAYVAATASDEGTRQRGTTAIARLTCVEPDVRLTLDVVAGVPMVFAELHCRVSSMFGAARNVVSGAHAPMEIP